MPSADFEGWNAVETPSIPTYLPPLLSWKHALLPVHPAVDLLNPADANETPRLKERRLPGSLLVPLNATSKLLQIPIISPSLSPLSPWSSTSDSNEISSKSSNTTTSPSTLTPELPGSWRRSASYDSSSDHPQRFTHSISRSTGTLPLDSKFSDPWRRSANEADFKSSLVVREPKVRSVRSTRVSKEQTDHPLSTWSLLEVQKPKQKIERKPDSTKSEPLSDELNCAVYITNIPVEATPSEVFDYIHSGAVQALHMYPSTDRHLHQAAKLVFAKAESAALLVDQARGPFHCYMGDTRLYVAYNRNGSRAYEGSETRVLIIEGPSDLMTYEHWKESFDNSCFYLLDRWSYQPCAQGSRMKMEFRFLSAGMAKACSDKIKSEHREEGEHRVSVAYGKDVCGASYLEPWAAPK